jgi:regulator of sigma E protease
LDFVPLLQSVGLGYIVPFIFVLTIVVFFHELGHFWVARRCGVWVETFSIGFGKPLLKWKDKHGTFWQIGWLPLGGYVKFLGDENEVSAPDMEKLGDLEESVKSQTLFYKPLWQRAAVVSAGPIANFILAIVIFAGLFSIYGKQIARPVVDQVLSESAAEMAGFQSGDLIISIDGKAIEAFQDVQRLISVNAEQLLKVEVIRDGQPLDLMATPSRVVETDRFGNEFNVGRLGVSISATADDVVLKRYGPLEAISKGVDETYFIVSQTFTMLGRIITGRESAAALGGPIKIAQISGQTATLGLVALIHLTAVLSVSIGLINLFPIPMLDGGHLAFYLYEAVFRRPMSERVQEVGMRVGLAMVLSLFVFVTFNDLSQLGVFEKIANVFGS